MADLESETSSRIFSCHICGKTCAHGWLPCLSLSLLLQHLTPCSVEAALKRHTRYCRKTLSNPPPSRRKACLACIRAKTRCTGGQPKCEQCERKRISCIYASNSSVSKSSETAHMDYLSPLDFNTTRAADLQDKAEESQYFHHNIFVASSDMIAASAPQPPQPGIRHEDGVTYLNESENGGSQSRGNMKPTYLDSLLRRKGDLSSDNILVQNPISQMLCALLEKKMTADSHPSFIHHSMFSRPTSTPGFEDPLVTCRQISQLFATHVESGSNSIWDRVASDQARIYDNRTTFDKWLTLSGAQAVTIYLLLLAAKGERMCSVDTQISPWLFCLLWELYLES